MPRKPTKARDRQRARRGNGTIFWSDARGLYIGRKLVKDESGRSKYAERWGRTVDEVQQKLDLAGPATDGTTVAELAAKWLADLDVRPSTREGYARSASDYIIPAIGGAKVKDVKTAQVSALVRKWSSSGLAPGTVANLRAHGRAMFELARRDDVRNDNPFALARRPKGEPAAIHPFSPDELRRIIDAGRDLSAGHLLALLAAVGCRLGEASALDVTDYNPVAGTVAITKTYSKRFGIGPPKSKHSRRTIVVPVVVRPMLAAAIGERTSGPLFVTGNGRRFIKSMVGRALDRVLTRLDLPRRNVHQLRHSVASALVGAGCPLADTARFLGDSVAVVVRTYLHPTGANPALEMDRMLVGSEIAARKVG